MLRCDVRRGDHGAVPHPAGGQAGRDVAVGEGALPCLFKNLAGVGGIDEATAGVHEELQRRKERSLMEVKQQLATTTINELCSDIKLLRSAIGRTYPVLAYVAAEQKRSLLLDVDVDAVPHLFRAGHFISVLF